MPSAGSSAEHLPAWLANSSCYLLSGTLYADVVSRLRGGAIGSCSSLSNPAPHHLVVSTTMASSSPTPVATDLLADPTVIRYLHLLVPNVDTTAMSSPIHTAAATTTPSWAATITRQAAPWTAPCTFPALTMKSAPALASFFHFLTLVRSLPQSMTVGLYMEAVALFVSLARAVQTSSLVIRVGVNLESFLSFVIACVVQLREEGEEKSAAISRAPFDKLVIDEALSHMLGVSNKGYALWTPHEREVLLAVARGTRNGTFAVVSHRHHSPSQHKRPKMVASLLVDLLGAAEAILDAHRTPGSKGSIGAVYPLSTESWSAQELSTLAELLAIFAVIDTAPPARLNAILSTLCSTELLLDALRCSDEGPTTLVATALLTTVRYCRVNVTGAQAASPASPQSLFSSFSHSNSKKSPPPLTIDGEDLERSTACLPWRVGQEWLAVLADVDAFDVVPSPASSSGDLPVNQYSSDSQQRPKSNLYQATHIMCVLRVAHIFLEDVLCQCLEDVCEPLSQQATTKGNSRAADLPGHKNSIASNGVLQTMNALLASCTPPKKNRRPVPLVARWLLIPRLPELTSADLTISAATIATVLSSNLSDRIAGLIQDVIRLLVGSSGAYATLRRAAEAAAHASRSTFVSRSNVRAPIGEGVELFAEQTEQLVLHDVRRLFTTIRVHLDPISTSSTVSFHSPSHSKGLCVSALGQVLSSLATELLQRCVEQLQRQAMVVAVGGAGSSNVPSAAADVHNNQPCEGDGTSVMLSVLHVPSAAVVMRALSLSFNFVREVLLQEILDVLATRRECAPATGSTAVVDPIIAHSRRPSQIPPPPGAPTNTSAAAVIPGLWKASLAFILDVLSKVAVTDQTTLDDRDALLLERLAHAAGRHDDEDSANVGAEYWDLCRELCLPRKRCECSPGVRFGAMSSPLQVQPPTAHDGASASPTHPQLTGSSAASSNLLLQVVHTTLDQFLDAVREEVASGRTLVSTHSIMSRSTSIRPLYVSDIMVSMYHTLEHIARANAQRCREVCSAVFSTFLSRRRNHAGMFFGVNSGGEEGCVRGDAAGSTRVSAAIRRWLQSCQDALAREADDAAMFALSLARFALALGWPGSGALYSNKRSELYTMVSVGAVLQTMLAPILAVLCQLQHTSLVASRASATLSDLLNGRCTLAHVRDTWREFYREYDATVLMTSYRLCGEATKWSVAESATHAQVLRSFWTLLSLYGITTSAVESIVNKLKPAAPGAAGSNATAEGTYTTLPAPDGISAAAATGASPTVTRAYPAVSTQSSHTHVVTLGTPCANGSAHAGESSVTDCSVADVIAAIHNAGEAGASKFVTSLVGRLALVAPPFAQLRTLDCQQAFADISSFERYITAGGRQQGGVTDVMKATQAVVTRMCPALSNGAARSHLYRLPLVELLFVRCVLELETLRAANGCVHVALQYSQVELREFVVSRDMIELIPNILEWFGSVFIAALQKSCSSVVTAVKALVIDATAAVHLASVGTLPVRRQALALLHQLVRAFPHLFAESDALTALLHSLNVLQTGDEEELTAFSNDLCIRHVAVATSALQGSDRQQVHKVLLQAATEWIEAAKRSIPHKLFESALHFITEQETSNLLGMTHFSGIELAIRACTAAYPQQQQQVSEASALTSGALRTSWLDEFSAVIPKECRTGVLVLASSRLRNYANSIMRRTRAAGAIDASLQHSSMSTVEGHLLSQLVSRIQLSLASLSTSPKLSERLLVKMAARQKAAGSHSPTVAGGVGVTGMIDDARRRNSPQPASDTHTQVHQVLELFSSFASVSALVNTSRMHRASLSTTLLYVVQGPVQLFSASVLHSAVGCWKWLLVGHLYNHIDDARAFLSHLVSAIEWTSTQRLGIFDGAPHTQQLVVETGCTRRDAYRVLSAVPGGDAEHVEDLYASDYATNSPHKILVSFLAEHFVDRRLAVSNDPVVLRLLFRLATCWTRDAALLSLKEESFSEFFRGLLLVLHIIENVHIANVQRGATQKLPPVVPYGCLVTLRVRTYDCLFQWFTKIPVSYVMAQELASVVLNEVYVLEALVDTVGREQDRLTVSSRGFLPRERDLSEAVSVPSTGRHRRIAASANNHSTPTVQTPGVSPSRPNPPGGFPVPAAPSLRSLTNAVPISESFKKLHNQLGLLRFLLKLELQRLVLWSSPRTSLSRSAMQSVSELASEASLGDVSSSLWKAYCESAALVSPDVLVALTLRVSNPHVLRFATAAVTNNPGAYAHIPAAVDLYLHEGTLQSGAEHLYLWKNCSVVQSLRLLDVAFQPYSHVVSYAIRSLMSTNSKHLIFYLPQLLQCLAYDRSGRIEGFLRTMAQQSVEFSHQLIWSLQTEGEGEGVLASKCVALSNSIRAAMTPEQATFYENEFRYINDVIAVSGILKPVEKAKRKERLRSMLATNTESFHAPIQVAHLYLPTNPTARIKRLVPHTAGAMQSAAKCPILVQFEVEERNPEDISLPKSVALKAPNSATEQGATKNIDASSETAAPLYKACIFKMGDDCRQDQIALQIIEFIQRVLTAVQLPCFLHPYRVVTTGTSSGIIECVPNAMSRDQIGKLVESNIAEYFVQTYGHPQSPEFRRARYNFVLSMASYSVVSYILNIKDRHNGNIMLDKDGHLIHIDFGFIFDYSPGGDMNFESSPFKLTQEMLQLMGDSVSGSHTVQSPELAEALLDPESYQLFVRSVVLCYLAVRQYGRQICILVELMLGSGLPCFKPKKTISDLANRLSVNRTEVEAAVFMFERVAESRDNMRTRLYDRYQNIAEGIEI